MPWRAARFRSLRDLSPSAIPERRLVSESRHRTRRLSLLNLRVRYLGRLINPLGGSLTLKLPPFVLERYFAQYEFNVPYSLCASDCETVSIGDLLAREAGAAEALHGLRLGYTESLGSPELRSEIAGIYRTISADEVLVFAGAEEAIFAFMNVVLATGDHLIAHDPCYQSLHEVARASGCEVTAWTSEEASDWQLDLSELRAKLRPETRAVVINCPHNPTGWLISHAEWRELAALSQEHGFLIFSDEVYRGLEQDPADRLEALCDVDERGVSLGVMSKTYGLPGLRIGWIATHNRDLYRRMAAFKDYTTICSSGPSEFLAALALRHRDPIVERNLGIIRRNLPLLNAFFADYADQFLWRAPKAGPIAFPALISGHDPDTFCRRIARETGVLLLPGTVYGEQWRHLRIGFGRSNMPDALERLRAGLAAHGV